MSLQQEISLRGGVARTAALFDVGFSQHDLAKAAKRGDIVRPRRGWVAAPDADPQLLFAARHGVVLSCITQARRLGLWVLNDDHPHVSVRFPSRKGGIPDGTVHWRQPLVVRAPDLLGDHIENVLDCVAACQPHGAALAVWDSALQKHLVDHAGLAALPLRGKSLTLLEEANPFSDSGLEALFRTSLKWLRVSIRFQLFVLGHRVDFLIGDRLIVQIDGATHTGAQRTEDIRHDAELIQRGYHVIRLSYSQIVHDWPTVHDLIIGAIARGLHLAK
ncbi:MAG: DUF559 domain-containing protein [Leucobacter sp.]